MQREDGIDGLLALPFAPGEAPFKVKGLAYRGHLKYVEDYVPGGLEAMLDRLDDARMREFFGQSFLASSYYDVVPLALAGSVCAAATDTEFLEFVGRRTQHQAKIDVRGIHRALLQFVTVTAISKRMPWLVKQYFNFGRTEATVVAPGHVRTAIHGVPGPLAPWFGTVCRSYVQTALRIRGVPTAQCDALEATPDGRIEGIPAVTEQFDTTWAA